MLNVRDVIMMICKETGVDPDLIFKRGKPGALQRQIRQQADDYIKGKLTDVKNCVVIEPEKISKPVEVVTVPHRKFEYKSALMNFRGFSNFSKEENDEMDSWISELGPKLSKFYGV